MALNKPRLKAALKALYQDADVNGGDNREDQLDYFCEKLADVIIDEVKELKIIYTTGLTAGVNAVVGTITHTVD